MKTLFAAGNVIPAAKVVNGGWPEDARVTGAFVNAANASGVVTLIIESSTFDEVSSPESLESVPFLDTTFETLPEVVEVHRGNACSQSYDGQELGRGSGSQWVEK